MWKYNYKKEFDNYKEDVTNEKYKICDEQINYFYNHYKKEKNKNSDFDIDIEKSRLVFKINNQISSIITFYFGVIVSIILFIMSIYGNYIIKGAIICFIISLTVFVIRKIMIANEQSDMWHRALIALEKVANEEAEVNTNKFQELQMVEVKRIKEFLNIK